MRWPVAVAVLAIGALLVGCSSDDSQGSAPALAGVVRTPPLDVSEVTMPNASDPETVVTMKAAPGELLLVYFGYTNCPDICPTTMSDMSVAMADLPTGQADRIKVAMVAIDPDRDTGEVLDAYLGHFFERTVGLRTEDPDELLAVTNAFGVQFEVADHDSTEEEYEVSHTAVTYVVDDTGTVVVEWPFGMDSADMATDLTALLSGPDST